MNALQLQLCSAWKELDGTERWSGLGLHLPGRVGPACSHCCPLLCADSYLTASPCPNSFRLLSPQPIVLCNYNTAKPHWDAHLFRIVIHISLRPARLFLENKNCICL